MKQQDWIQTYTGKAFWFPDITANEIDIHDIAHSLAMQCRFNGHSNRFYSVAQHSVLVSRIVPSENALAGLLHDASEAYLTDIPSPLKKMSLFAEYRLAEKSLQERIYRHFGLREDEPKTVKFADYVMGCNEAEKLMSPLHPKWTSRGSDIQVEFTPENPEQAERSFLYRFYQLYK